MIAARPPKLRVIDVGMTHASARGPVVALAGVSLEVAAGEFVCLLGPSGCGKSTLLALVAGLEAPSRGRILADERPVTGPGRDRMVMFQEAALFPWRSVLGNVLFGLELDQDLSRAERHARALRLLDLVGLAAFARARVHELSGGMKQRVALARALAPDPGFLLMDEPFGALDAMTREQLYADLQHIQQERQKTVLAVTHNVREAVCLGDRVLLFSSHPGRIRAEFAVPLPRPRDLNDPHVAALAQEITGALRAPAAAPTAIGVAS